MPCGLFVAFFVVIFDTTSINTTMADGDDLPVWEKEALRNRDRVEMEMWAPKCLVFNRRWNDFAPLPADPNHTIWCATKKGAAWITKNQRATLNRAIKNGWFVYGWDHPPQSGGADGKCNGACCPGWDAVFTDGGPSKSMPPLTDYMSDDNDNDFVWRFARAMFFDYFGSRALALKNTTAPSHAAAGGTLLYLRVCYVNLVHDVMRAMYC